MTYGSSEIEFVERVIQNFQEAISQLPEFEVPDFIAKVIEEKGFTLIKKEKNV